MKKVLSLLLIAICAIGCNKQVYPDAPDKPSSKDESKDVVIPTDIVFRLAGEAPCAEYKESQRPQAGWGEYLAAAIGEGAQVVNYAVSGIGTGAFISKGKWDKLVADIQPGDVVMIQFGHSDSKEDDTNNYSDPETFKANLTKFITDVRAKEGKPVLLTCITHRYFNASGVPNRTHGEYPSVIRSLASSSKTPLLDVEEKTYTWMLGLGEQGSAKYFMVYKMNQTNPDNTNLCDEGAEYVAGLIVKELKKLKPWE